MCSSTPKAAQKAEEAFKQLQDEGVINLQDVHFGSDPALAERICTNAYTSSILPQFRSRIIPVRGIVCRITTPDPATAPRLPTTYALRFGSGLMDYLIQRPSDNSIIVGGAQAAFIYDLPSWYDNVSDDRLISSAAARYFDGYMQHHF